MSARRIAFTARDGLVLSALDHPGPEHRTPLLCLPGLTRSAEDFDDLAARHAGRRRVLALDHAGHGESARAREVSRYGIEDSLRDVLDAMAALHCHRAVLVGTSFGGILGMVLGVVRPTVLAGVVLNDVGPVLQPVGLESVQDLVGRDPALPGLDAAVAHLKDRLPPLVMDAPAWQRFAARTFRPGPDGAWHPRWDIRIARAMGAGGPMPDLWPAFGALAHAPLLLLRGEVSGLLSRETADAMRAARPDMAFAEIPATGHCPTLEEPAAVAALDAFLDRIA
ncbi:alpha/beta fold hydrolase [Falsiroseomonas selenitidurans]|uniref:Alpha/beta hydrolase n=1 Tax=Falsiroseomonas selenitidurans TaxID=2716335 RepID=A0ABX1DZP0_9PROT|nr:alpha/beta hydrolase [Falsiroseomonas selenitidurans]NKC30374.1 alpha/beta hydrolase [Falsiroseomonas selenitidurans]